MKIKKKLIIIFFFIIAFLSKSFVPHSEKKVNFKKNFVLNYIDMRSPEKIKIQQVLNVFETGSKDGDYSNISIFKDGPNDRRQITYGRSQTTEYGHLAELIKNYSLSGGIYSLDFVPYIGKIGKENSFCDDERFLDLLKKAGKDPVMECCQDSLFENRYWQKEEKWFKDQKFKETLSMLVIYDSFIHSGSILSFLEKRFTQKTPANGGDEKAWIKNYVDVRKSWLADHRRLVLRKTIYRTGLFQKLIEQGNWDLKKEFSTQSINFEEEIFDNFDLPAIDNIPLFYSKKVDHLTWFSFPMNAMRAESRNGRLLLDKINDDKPDYVCNKQIKENLESALNEIYQKLGKDRFVAEGWNVFSGGYKKEGSIAETTGILVSFNKKENLNTQVLSDMSLNIMEKWGFLNVGRATGKDFGSFIAAIPEIFKTSYYSKEGLPEHIKAS